MSVSARSAAAEERSVNSSTMGESQLWAAATQVGGSGLGGALRPPDRAGETPSDDVGSCGRRRWGGPAAGPGRGGGGPGGRGESGGDSLN